MRRIVNGFVATAFLAGAACAGADDSFNYELFGEVSHSSFDEIGPADQSANSYALAGTWYFDAVDNELGPRSRAAFLSRASGLGLAYSYLDLEYSATFTNALPQPQSVSADTGAHTLSLSYRHVWKESGWFAQALAARTEINTDVAVNGVGSSASFDDSAFGIGIGKYLGAGTTLGVSFLQEGSSLAGSSSNDNAVLVSFSHVGDLGGGWQFGTDLGYGTAGIADSDRTAFGSFSLYPTRDLSLSFGVQAGLGGNVDPRSYSISGGWFLRDNLELNASYDWSDSNSSLFQDEDTVGVGVRLRF